MRIRVVFLLLLVVCLAIPARAQSCPTIPAEQWSSAPDASEIPPAADAWLLTYQNTYYRGKANHLVSYVQTGPNEQNVWFFVNSVPHHTKIYYNRRFRTSASAPWNWAYALSPMVLQVPGPGSVSANAVLYSATPKYGDGTTLYKYVMYLVNQPSTCDGVVAGFATVSFSNDGLCWTTPAPMRRDGGGSSAPCAPELGTAVITVEAFDAIDAGNQIYFMGIHGDVARLVDANNMNDTAAWWGSTSPAAAHRMSFAYNADVSASGVVSPLVGFTSDERYAPYKYFINMAMAWDAARGDLYLTRSYPYPYDRPARPEGESSQVPSPLVTAWTELYNAYLPHRLQHVEGCQGGEAAYPNRVQIYRMRIGSLSNFSQVRTGTWTLLADYGNAYGYWFGDGPTRTPIVYPQQSLGRDYGMASFLRDSSGNLAFSDGGAYVFGGTHYLSPTSDGPCRTTGSERTYLIPIPFP